jgi:hypothetical protein
LWKNCPRTNILNGHIDRGFGFIDDFLGGAVGPLLIGGGGGGWTVDNATTGTAALIDRKGGWLQLDSAAAVADQGAQIQRLLDTAGGECFIASAASKIYLEWRIEPSDLGGLVAANGAQLFFGLHPRDPSIFASGVMSGDNYIGFVYDAADTGGTWQFEGAKADTTDSNDTGVAIVDDASADARQRLGLLIDGVTSATPYINGVAYPAAKIPTAGIPIVEMAPSAACLSEGTVDPLVNIDYCACFQVESIDD